MSRFKPVFWPDGVGLGDGVSQTFLRHLNLCPRSAFLYQLHRGEQSTVEMQRGRAGHAALEASTRAVVENGAPAIPYELAKAMLDGVLEDPAYWVPIEHHDYLREAVYRWASNTTFEPESIVAVEDLFEWDVAGWRVRCRIDYADLLEHGGLLRVRDYKFGPGAPPQDAVARVREDGSLMAKNMQLILYALVLTYGVPVREERCSNCLGDGNDIPFDPEAMCETCGGKGRVEIREPFPVASRAGRYELEFTFPGIKHGDGMLTRPMTLTRSELEAYVPSVRALLDGLSYRIESGDWPALVSDDACAICPAKLECPLRSEVKDFRGAINEPAECAQALEVREIEKKVSGAKTREITAFIRQHGPVRFGGGMVAEIQASSSTEIRDKDGFLAAVQRSVQYGEPLDRSVWVKEKTGSRLVVRALSEDEIASEGSNG